MLDFIPEFKEFFEDYEDKKKYRYKEKKNKSIVLFAGTGKPIPKEIRPQVGIPIIEDIKIIFKGKTVVYKYEYYYSGDDTTFCVRSNQDIMTHLLKTKQFKNEDGFLKRIVRDYFDYVTDFFNKHMGNVRYNGWMHYGEGWNKWVEYLKIDSPCKEHPFTLLPKRNYTYSNDIIELLTLMNRYPRLALIFAYGIRSVSTFRFMPFEDTINCWNTPEYEDWDRPFFLCLCGTLTMREEHDKKEIASVFLDYMMPTGIENKFNCRHRPHFSLQDIDYQFKNLFLIGDIPIIVIPSGNVKSISGSSSAVKKLENMQANGLLKGHPVFLSDAPIRRDSILNIDVAGFTDIDLGRTIGQVHKLIYEFIQYLEELQPGNSLHMEENNTGRIRYNISYLREMKREIAYHFNEKDSNPDMLSHCQNLLAALECFKCFIEVKYNEFLEIMESITKQAAELLCEMSLDSEKINLLKKSNEKGNMSLQNSCVDMFIAVLKEQNRIKPDSILRSGGEYHVDFDTFCELLPSVLKQNRQENLSYKQILSQCREMEEPLITPNYRNKASKTYRELYFMRNGKKVLLVPAEIYERYFPMD